MARRKAAPEVGSSAWYDEQLARRRHEATKPYNLEDYGPEDRDEILLFGSPGDPDGAWSDDELCFSMSRFGPDPKEAILWDLVCHFKGAARLQAIREPPYRDLDIAELLLHQSAKSQPDSLGQALDMAELAEAIALLSEPNEKRRAEWIRVKACCLQANVWRFRRDWVQSERRFGEAWRALAGWSEDAPERRSLLRGLSALREDQGRFDEAVELLRRAVTLRNEMPQVFSEEVLLTRQGLIHLKQNDLGRAMTLLSAVAENIAEDQMIGMLVRHEVALGRAACLAALDLREPARRLLEDERVGRALTQRTKERLRFEWFDCRINLRLGDTTAAIPRLEALERWFHSSYPCEACLCWLDLRQAYEQSGRPPRDFHRLNDLLAGQQSNLDYLLPPPDDEDPDCIGSPATWGIPIEWLVECVAEIRSISDRTADEWAELRQRLGCLVPSPLVP